MVCELCKVLECICKSKSYNGPVKYVENLMDNFPGIAVVISSWVAKMFLMQKGLKIIKYVVF